VVDGLNGGEVTGFLLAECGRGLSVSSAQLVAAGLRSVLRFLYVQGPTACSLADAVPPVAGQRDTRLPASLAASDVTALMAGCDRAHPTGIRDFAILLLLARLGLRAAEVAGLELDDVDWRRGLVVVRGKGGREDLLPLPGEVGEAPAVYLQHARPRAECRTMFLTRVAPWRVLRPNTVSRVVGEACRRAGVPPVGAHRLRHALATAMLARGAGLVEIGQVLRHRDLAATAAYARVDQTSLRQVARPWPGTHR